MENQTLPEKYMPLRILGYDGATYRSQLQKKRKRPVAVLTIVLYFGTDKMWDKPTHLKDVIYIPEGLGEYVNDYKITVFNIAWLTEEEIARFKSDFKIVANFFVHKRKNKDYVSDDKTEIKHVDEVLKLLSAMTGDERYEEILAEKEKGEYNTMGVLCIVLFYYLQRFDKVQRTVLGAVMVGVAEPKAAIAFLPIYLYNGERGMKLKYFFYWVYPVHLLVLGLIRVMLY